MRVNSSDRRLARSQWFIPTDRASRGHRFISRWLGDARCLVVWTHCFSRGPCRRAAGPLLPQPERSGAFFRSFGLLYLRTTPWLQISARCGPFCRCSLGAISAIGAIELTRVPPLRRLALIQGARGVSDENILRLVGEMNLNHARRGIRRLIGVSICTGGSLVLASWFKAHVLS